MGREICDALATPSSMFSGQVYVCLSIEEEESKKEF
jgi:hypothetical protein